MKAYFRFHQGSLAGSMDTLTEVKCMDDLVRILADAVLKADYYTNIHIGEHFKDERCEPYGAGSDWWYVLADFNGYEDQCAGFINVPKLPENMSKYLLKEMVEKYYNQLDGMVNDLAVKCTGGEEATLSFPLGKITIKLK